MVQGSQEWLDWRMSGIGASEIAALMGVCPYNTPHSVWLVKTKRVKGFEGNSFTEHGKDTEAAARARYELQTMEDMPPACATHPTFKMCLASFDGWNKEQKKLLEIKCPVGESVITDALAGIVSAHYLPQCQYQMGVAGADNLDFFVFHEATKRDALVEVKADIAYQGKLFATAEHFWNTYVLTDTPPPLTDRDVKIVEDNDDLLKLSEIILNQKDSGAKKALDLLKHQFIEIGGHNKVKCGRVQVSTVNRQGKFSYYKLTVSA